MKRKQTDLSHTPFGLLRTLHSVPNWVNYYTLTIKTMIVESIILEHEISFPIPIPIITIFFIVHHLLNLKHTPATEVPDIEQYRYLNSLTCTSVILSN